MYWFLLSLGTAFIVASHDAFIKRFFSDLSPYGMLACSSMYSLPFFAIAVIFITKPCLDSIFFWSFGIGIPLNLISFLMYMHSIKVSPLSLTVPFLAFTPVFVILTGYIFLGEVVSVWGNLGIVMICLGGYTLNIEPGKWTFLAPLKAVVREKGSWVMLVVAFLFAFGAVIGKLAILHSSPLFYTMWFFLIFNVFLLMLFYLCGKIDPAMFKDNHAKGFTVGILLFLHALLHGFAISMTKAAYMISVKRTSIIFSIIYGKYFFHEKNIAFRISGAVLMLSGTVMIMVNEL